MHRIISESRKQTALVIGKYNDMYLAVMERKIYFCAGPFEPNRAYRDVN